MDHLAINPVTTTRAGTLPRIHTEDATLLGSFFMGDVADGDAFAVCRVDESQVPFAAKQFSGLRERNECSVGAPLEIVCSLFEKYGVDELREVASLRVAQH